MNHPIEVASTHRTSPLRMAAVWLLVLLVGLAGMILPPPAHAADDTGALGTLGPVLVTQTGTSPFPVGDGGATDALVASGDAVKWSVPYTTATPGRIALVASLPSGSAFDPSTISLCAPGSSIDATGSTATCLIDPATPGSGAWNVLARVTGANGATVSLKAAASSLSAESPSTGIIAAPNFGTRAAGAVLSAANGDGADLSFEYGFYVEIDPSTGLRGREALADPITFDIDTSSLPDGWTVTNCNANPGSASPARKGGGDRAVRDSGTANCVQNDDSISVTITGADTSALSYPKASSGGTALAANQAWVISSAIYINLPAASIPVGVNSYSLQIRGFDPDSISGQSNLGGGYAAGQQPGSAPIDYVNSRVLTVNNTPGGGSSSQNYFVEPGTTQTALSGWQNVSSGGNPLFAGQPLELRPIIINRSPVGATMTGFEMCETWDPATVDLTRAVRSVNEVDFPIEVEYGVLPGSPQTQRSSCGAVGDGTANWYANPADAPDGIGSISAIRFRTATVPAQVALRHLAVVPLERTSAPLDDGTPIPFAWQYRADGMASPVRYELTQRAAEGRLTNEITAADANVSPGGTTTLSVIPKVTNPHASDLVTYDDVAVAVTLPPTVSYVLGSASVPLESSATDVHGNTVLRFPLGSVTSGAAATPITFQVQASTSVVMPQGVAFSSTVSAPGTVEPESTRTSIGSFAINAPQQFGFTKSVSAAVVQPGDPLTYTTAAFNTLADPVGPFASVDVLPYEGDVNGTTGLVSFTVASIVASAGQSVFYTTDEPAQVRGLTQSDIDTTAVNWIEYTGGALPAGITAIKTTKPTVSPNEVVDTRVVLSDIVAAEGAKIGNSLTALYASGGTTVPVKDASRVISSVVASDLSGVVYLDVDHSGTLSVGDLGLAGRTVTLGGYAYGSSGVDQGGSGTNVPVPAGTTTVTSASGGYTFTGLASGSYTVTVAPPSGMTSNGDVVESAELAVDTTLTAKDIGFYPLLDQPIARADTARIPETGASTVDVLANDTGEAIALAASVAPTATSGATAAYVGDRLLVTPGVHTWSADETSYVVTASYSVVGVFGLTSRATVEVIVVRAPQAIDDSATTGFGRPVTIPVTGNDIGSVVTLKELGVSPDGTAVVSGDAVVFTPAVGFSGTTTFSYTIEDEFGQTATGNVLVTVGALPVAMDDTARTGAATAVTVPVLANDAPGATLTSVGASEDGTVVANADGTVTFTPAAGFSGEATFGYMIADGTGVTGEGAVTVTVFAAPAAQPSTAQTGAGIPVTTAVLTSAVGEAVVLAGIGAATHGTAVTNSDGTVTFTPDAGFAGTASYTYLIVDEFGVQASAVVTVLVVDGPAAVNDVVRTGQEQSVTIDVLANDAPASGLAIVSAAPATGGVAEIDGAAIRFTPDDGFTGAASFTYTVRDEFGNISTATVQVDVVAPPIASAVTVASAQDATTEIDMTAEVTGANWAVSGLGTTSAGMVSAVGDTVVFTPEPGFAGDATFSYTVTDEFGQTATSGITVHVIAPPTAVDQSARVGQDVATRFDVLATATGEGLSVTADAGANGAASVDQEGRVVFVPKAGFSGVAEFDYTVTDRVGQTATGMIVVTVVGRPQAHPDRGSTSDLQAVDIDVLANDEGDAVTLQSVGTTPAGFVERVDGLVRFTPGPGVVGDVTFAYTVVDSIGQLATGMVTVQVKGTDASTSETGSEPVPHAGDALAQTGASFGLTLVLVGTMFVVGILLMVANRRRRSS